MSTLDQARATQLKNIETKTGKTLPELQVIILKSGLSKHSEIRDMLISQFGLGYGDATMLVHYALQTDGQSAAEASGASTSQVLDEIYSGPKAALRPVHDRVMEHIVNFGEFEIVPKKGYLSLRRKRQFAMIGPATNSKIEIGLNAKGLAENPRLAVLQPGGMCQYKVRLSATEEVDGELVAWLKQAYDSAI